MKKKYVVFGALFVSVLAFGQTPWPAVQAENYPLVSSMKLVRHEQSVLLGESGQQTGLFFAQLGQTYSERVQSQLIGDAKRKGWDLQSAMRFGTQYVLAFSKGARLLDIRLTNTPDGVEAVYSVVLNQQSGVQVGAPVPAVPSSAATSPAPNVPAASR